MSSLHFGSAAVADSRANTSTSLHLQFMYNKDIRPADIVTVQLPSFAGASNSNLTLTSVSTPLTASWNMDAGSLTVTFESNLSAGTLAEIVISESNGIVLPTNGVQANQTQITIAAAAEDGGSDAVPVLMSEQVGAFMMSSLDFVGAAATMPAKLVLNFKMSCPIEVGDTLTLSLPGFSGTNNSNLTESSGGFLCSWDVLSHSMVFTATQTVPIQATVVTIEPTESLQMPINGLIANTSSVQLSAQSRLCPAEAVALQRVSPIGAFSASELSISPASASLGGIPVDIRIRFNFSATVRTGEIISLKLPGWRGSANGTYGVFTETTTPADYLILLGALSGTMFRHFSASWSNITDVLSFTANQDVSGPFFDIAVPKTSSLALPSSGLVANTAAILLSTNAVFGPSAGQPVLKSPRVGSFSTSSVAFLNARAGGAADIEFNFTLMKEIASGESVTLTLPHFSGTSFADLQLQQSVNVSVDWTNATKQLRFLFSDGIMGNQSTSVIVPASSNIRLPDVGIESTHPITISTNASSGPVESIPVNHIPAVGGFVESSLYFGEQLSTDTTAGQITSLTIVFRYGGQLQAGSSVFLRLPLFSGSSTSSLTIVAESGGGFFTGSWDRDTSLITLVCGSRVNADALVSITIGSSSHIALPQTGVLKNQESITIATDNPNLPSSPAPVMIVEPVGVFSNFTVSFSPQAAGSPTTVRLNFTPNNLLLNGDSVLVRLPNFTGGNSDVSNFSNITTANISNQHPVFSHAIWNRSATLLTVHASGTGFAGVPHVIVIHAAGGLSLPAVGVAGNQSGITVTCKCAASPLLNSAPDSVESVPALFSGVSVNGLKAKTRITAPQSDGVAIELLLSSISSSNTFAAGDLLCLRKLASSCFESRLNYSTSTRSADMIVNANFQAVLPADGLLPGTYALCYGRRDAQWVTNVGTDAETGLHIVIQNAIRRAKVGLQSFGTKLEGPRNDFALTMETSLFPARLSSGDAISVVHANYTCDDVAYSSASVSSTVNSALSSVTADLTSSIVWPSCVPGGSPPAFMGACPATGVYRLCFRDHNSGVPEETGISITIKPVTLALATDNSALQTVDAFFSSLTVSLTSEGVQCCEGSKVLISLLKGTEDMSQYLYSGASNTNEDRIAISQNGTASFTDLNIRSIGGSGFILNIKVPDVAIQGSTFQVLPHSLRVATNVTGEYSYAFGSAVATLPTIRIEMIDSENQLLTLIQADDNFVVKGLLQTGGNGLDSMSTVSYASVLNADDLLPDKVRSSGLKAHAGVVEFSSGIVSIGIFGTPTTNYTNRGAASANCSGIVGCTGSGFAGICLVNGSGVVTGINVTSTGTGYSASYLPHITCADGAGQTFIANVDGIAIRRQAGNFRIEFQLALDSSIRAYAGPFSVAPASIAVDTLNSGSMSIIQLGSYPYGACPTSLAATQSACEGYSSTWTAATSNVPVIGVTLKAGDNSTLSNARGADMVFASLHFSTGILAPCGCSSSTPTTSRSPNNTGCSCTSTLHDGVYQPLTLVDATSGALPKRAIVGGEATFGGLRVQFQAGEFLQIRVKVKGTSSSVVAAVVAVVPFNLAVAVHPGGAGVDWHPTPPLNSNGSNVSFHHTYSALVPDADGVADGVGDGCFFQNQPVLFLQGNGYDMNGNIADARVNASLQQTPGGSCQLLGAPQANVQSDGTGLIKFTDLGVDCQGNSTLDLQISFQLTFGMKVYQANTMYMHVVSTRFDVFSSPNNVTFAKAAPKMDQGFRIDLIAPPISRTNPLSGFLVEILRCSSSTSLDSDLWQGGGGEVGLAQAANGQNVWLSPIARSQDDYYTGMSITIISGPGSGQRASITNYTGSLRRATLDRLLKPLPTSSSEYMISTDSVRSEQCNESAQFLPILVDSSRMDMAWDDLHLVSSISHTNVYTTQALKATIDLSHVIGMAHLEDEFVLESSSTLTVSKLTGSGIRVGIFLVIDAEVVLVTSVAMDKTIRVLREQQGSSILLQLAVKMTVTTTQIKFTGGVAMIATRGINVGCYLKIGSEIVLVTSIERDRVTVTRGQKSTSVGTHVVGTTVYNLHHSGAIAVREDKCSAGEEVSLNPCASPTQFDYGWGSTNLSNALVDVGASSATLEVDDASVIQAGKYIKMHSEVMLVTQVSGNVLSVLRAQKDSKYYTSLSADIDISTTRMTLQSIDEAGLTQGTFVKIDSEILKISAISTTGIHSIEIAGTGSAYTQGAAIVTCDPPCAGSGFAGICVVSDGEVTDFTITNIGSGYSSLALPVISCSGGSGQTFTPVCCGYSVSISRAQQGTAAAAHTANTLVYNLYGAGTLVDILAPYSSVTFSDGALSATFQSLNCDPTANYSQTGSSIVASTFLDSNLDPTVKSFSVTDAAGAGITPGTLVKIDEEIMSVTHLLSSNLLRVVRGVKGSLPTSHERQREVMVMSTSVKIAVGSVYSFRVIPFNDNFRGNPKSTETISRALVAPMPITGFAEVRQDADCFCNLSTLLSFASPLPTITAPRLGFVVEISRDPSFSTSSDIQLAVFPDRFDDDKLDAGVDASIEKDNLGPDGSTRLLQRVRILSSFQGLGEYSDSSAVLSNLSMTDRFYDGMRLSTIVSGQSKMATIMNYQGKSRTASVIFDGTPTNASTFAVGTVVAYMQRGLPTVGLAPDFVTIEEGTRYYFRISAYNSAGVSAPTMYSLQVLDATPRVLPTSGGKLIDLKGTGLGFQPESFSIFIGGSPCSSTGVKDKSGTHIFCVSGNVSGEALDLHVEFASGVYTNSRTVRGWFRSVRPTVTAIYPSKVRVGDIISITGSGFGAEPSLIEVSIADSRCDSTSLLSDTQVECLVQVALREVSAVTVTVNGQGSLEGAAALVAPAEEPVTVTITLDIPFSSIGNEGSPVRNGFISSFLDELATAAGVNRNLLSVSSVSAGSVILEVTIASDTSSPVSPPPAAVASFLQQAVEAAAASDVASSGMTSLPRVQAIVLPAAVSQLAEAASKQSKSELSSFRNECRSRLRRTDCMDCCTYKCEISDGPPSSGILHPGQVARVCLRHCAEVCAF